MDRASAGDSRNANGRLVAGGRQQGRVATGGGRVDAHGALHHVTRRVIRIGDQGDDGAGPGGEGLSKRAEGLGAAAGRDGGDAPEFGQVAGDGGAVAMGNRCAVPVQVRGQLMRSRCDNDDGVAEGECRSGLLTGDGEGVGAARRPEA